MLYVMPICGLFLCLNPAIPLLSKRQVHRATTVPSCFTCNEKLCNLWKWEWLTGVSNLDNSIYSNSLKYEKPRLNLLWLEACLCLQTEKHTWKQPSSSAKSTWLKMWSMKVEFRWCFCLFHSAPSPSLFFLCEGFLESRCSLQRCCQLPFDLSTHCDAEWCFHLPKADWRSH